MILFSAVMLVTVPLSGPKHRSQTDRPDPPPVSTISLFRQVMESKVAAGCINRNTPLATFWNRLLRMSTGPTFSPSVGSKYTASPQSTTRQFSTRSPIVACEYVNQGRNPDMVQRRTTALVSLTCGRPPKVNTVSPSVL